MAHRDEMSEPSADGAEAPFDPHEFLRGDVRPMLEENRFEVLVARSRVPYFQEVDGELRELLGGYGLRYELDAARGVCAVQNSLETPDPTAVLVARQLLRLVARYMPLDVARRVFEPGVESEVIAVDVCARRETFLKRRERFVGSNRQTLTALELLTNTRMQVYGGTVAVVGTARGIQLVQRVARDCFGRNVLPSHWIKVLMIRRELERLPEMRGMDWSNFMPRVRTSRARRAPRPYVPKPPPEERGLVDVGRYAERAVDRQLEAGQRVPSRRRAARRRPTE